MTSFAGLFRRFILRSLARDKLRSAITVLGISLGVAVMIAIRLANASSLESFRTATESIAGETTIQLAGSTGSFDEEKLRELGWLRGYGQVSPIITGYAMIGAPDPAAEASRREFIQIMGVDILRDRSLRKYHLLRLESEAEPTAREFLTLLVDKRSIVLTERFARSHGLAISNPIALVIGDQRQEFTIRGLLLDEGPARAFQGNFALMDIAAAQLAFNRLGLLDGLDVKLNQNVKLNGSATPDVEAVAADIAQRLPEGLVVALPESGYGQVERMIKAFHFNLNALGSIALLVGLFLIYNTVSVSVITRREEIGTLRAIGASRKTVLALFLNEALLLSCAGTLAGLVIGPLMATAAVKVTATTVHTFYIASAATSELARHKLGPFEIAMAFGIAIPLALVAAALPAVEASRVRPIEAIRSAERLAKSFKLSPKPIVTALFLLGTGCALTRFDAVNGLPLFGYAAALSLMFGGAFLVPGALWLACKAANSCAGKVVRWFYVEARLACANLIGAIPRVTISVAALAASLAMMIAISILIASFRQTVEYWVDQTLRADIYVKPVTRLTTSDDGFISDEAVNAISRDSEVAAVDAFTSQQIIFDGNQVTLGAGTFQVLADHGRLLFKKPASQEAALKALRQAAGGDQVVVSESFSIKFKKQPGDIVALPTPQGPREFKIAAVYYDYSSNRGTAVMDRSTYDRYFGKLRPVNLSIYLKPGAEPDRVRDRLTDAVGTRFQLDLTTNAAVRREVVRIFDSTFSITYALELIAILVAGLGVISTLITLILERRAQLATLGFIGATRRHIRTMVVIEALLLGGVSQAVGILIGLMLSLVLIYVINVQSFGWTIQFTLPASFLVRSTLMILAATAVAGLYPASRAAGVDAIRFAREE
jgi:putative ABC transport system permease protein